MSLGSAAGARAAAGVCAVAIGTAALAAASSASARSVRAIQRLSGLSNFIVRFPQRASPGLGPRLRKRGPRPGDARWGKRTMKLLNPLRRWMARTLRALALLAAASAAVPIATAQTPAAARAPAALPRLIYTKSTEFRLPVQMDERTRANLECVCLYVKCGAADWVRQETGAPTTPYFLYRVTQDGEYWFALTTIDKMGRMNPADVTQTPPALRVLVDTKAPVLDVSACTSPEGEPCLRCNLIDANPNPDSLKAVAKLPGGDRPLAGHPSQPNVFKAAGPELQSATIVVTASDLAGNQAAREVRLRDLLPPPAPVVQMPTPPA